MFDQTNWYCLVDMVWFLVSTLSSYIFFHISLSAPKYVCGTQALTLTVRDLWPLSYEMFV